MPTAEITVQYINNAKPGKKMGSIKSSEGEYYYCAPTMLHLFQMGEVCKVEFTERPKEGGGTWKTLTTKLGGPMKGPTPIRASTSPKDSQQIFITALLKEYVSLGAIPCDKASIVVAGNQLKGAYQELFGSTEKQKTEIELNDELPPELQ